MRTLPQHRRILGEAIRAHRAKAGLSQEKLAEKADLHPNYVSEIERGRKNVSIDTLARLARALNIRIHELTQNV